MWQDRLGHNQATQRNAENYKVPKMPEIKAFYRSYEWEKRGVYLYSFADSGFMMLKISGRYKKDGANPAEAGHNFRHFRHFRSLQAFPGLSASDLGQRGTHAELPALDPKG
jgi:hypothetical protein